MNTVIGAVLDPYGSPEHNAKNESFDVTVATSFASSRGTIAETISSLARQIGHETFELLLVSKATRHDSLEVAKTAAQGLPVRIIECGRVGYDYNARYVSTAEAASDNMLFVDGRIWP
jgi:hypothetical protein